MSSLFRTHLVFFSWLFTTINFSCLCRVLTALPIDSKLEEEPSACIRMEPEDRGRKETKVLTSDVSLKVVGWYHSHPDFPAHPTIIDVYNQCVEQEKHRINGWNEVPFVGAIISPYDRNEPNRDAAAITWFHVQVPTSLEAIPTDKSPIDVSCIPFKLKSSVYIEDTSDAENVSSLQKTIEHLAKSYAPAEDRINIEGLWRKDEYGRVILRLRKIISSFEHKLSRGKFEGKLRSFTLFKLEVLLRAVWSVYGRSTAGTKSKSSLGDDGTVKSGDTEVVEKMADVGKGTSHSRGEQLSEDEPISDEDDELTE